MSDPQPPPHPAPLLPTAFDAFLFSCKTAVSAVLALGFYEALHLPGSAWAAPVSAVIISQPTLQPSVQASLTRFWANLIGAGIGSVSVTLLGPTLQALLIGVLVAGLACHFLKLEEALRPAYASVVIVILTSKGNNVLADSLERVLAVMVGCSIALGVGLIFDKLLFPRLEPLRKRFPAAKPPQE